MKGGLLLDVVVIQRASILKLLSCKNQTLLIRRNARIDQRVTKCFIYMGSRSSPFLVLNLGLHIINSIRRFHLKGDRFSSEATNNRK
jgi:hypothetical protein